METDNRLILFNRGYNSLKSGFVCAMPRLATGLPRRYSVLKATDKNLILCQLVQVLSNTSNLPMAFGKGGCLYYRVAKSICITEG